jgi:hypothetical protein
MALLDGVILHFVTSIYDIVVNGEASLATGLVRDRLQD